MSTATATGFHDLASMIEYMETQCQKINGLAQELSEVQHEFEGHFVQTQQQFENARTSAAAWIEAQDCRQPAWVAEALVAGLPRVTEEQTAKRADLQKQLDELETQRTAIEQQNDATVNELRTANPDLNAREEQLKQQEETARLRFYQRVSEWHKAAGGVGWLLRPGAVRKAREAMEQANVDWVDGNARLTEVRNSWQTLEKKSSEAETNLQAAWRLRTAEIARLKRDLSRLQTDFEGTCRAAAVEAILGGIAEPKTSDQPEFDALLAKVVALHDEYKQYEAGIAQMAELMGVVKGVCEGLTRMAESVKSVKAEQDMHSELARLKINAPPPALAFHTLWDELQPLVVDEKQVAQHPADFAAKVKQVVGERLANAAIDAMFTSLGDELNRATKEQWK